MLQRGRALVSAEIPQTLRDIIALLELQRGRALVSAEIAKARVGEAWNAMLQRGRALVSAEMWWRSGDGPRGEALQRGRALVSAEMTPSFLRRHLTAPASTGPRFGKRGDISHLADPYRGPFASTGPRFGKRGDSGRADACQGEAGSQSRDRLPSRQPGTSLRPRSGHGNNAASRACNMRAAPGFPASPGRSRWFDCQRSMAMLANR